MSLARRLLIGAGVAYLLFAAGWVVSSGFTGARASLLNVACDPTRELWRDLNALFTADHEAKTGERVSVRQSHGGSGSQARAVIDGLQADVATLALWSDTDAIRKAGLMDEGWEDRLPGRSLPYTSTIVFVVRESNPLKVRDWPDLTRDGVKVIVPNPKTSGNGKWAFLAAWGGVLEAGGTEGDARAFMTRLYRNVPVLDTAARGATMTFLKGIGDVHLTWENEAYLEVEESGGRLEIVYPPASVLAEPHVAVIDANVRRRGTRAAAESYLRFLYTEEAQEVIARHYYRPTNKDIWKKHAARFPELRLFRFTRCAPTWAEIQRRFFAEGAAFDAALAEGRR